jgi:hypothetical protein
MVEKIKKGAIKMHTDKKVLRKIDLYHPDGLLDHSSKFFLHMASARHPDVKAHAERVALLTQEVAIKEKLDVKAAFFAGLLHDIGKIVLPDSLFDGHNIDAEEYATVKEHALLAFNILKDTHLFVALCAGLHHNVYKAGYGITQAEFPDYFGVDTIKKVLDISVIISICDFIDAFTHRDTKIKDGSDSKSPKLRDMLHQKYPNDYRLVEVSLKANKELGL